MSAMSPLRLPKSGVTPVIQLKKHAKERYRYEVQRLQCRQDYLRCKRMAEALVRDLTHHFWSDNSTPCNMYMTC